MRRLFLAGMQTRLCREGSMRSGSDDAHRPVARGTPRGAHRDAHRSGSPGPRRTGLRGAALLAIVCLAAPAPARALEFADVRGHLAIGFAHLATSDSTDTPGGSITIGAGADIPVGGRFRAGIDVGYHLLGSKTLEQGSLTSGIDYSVFEVLALAHWSPLSSGPELIVSGGPGFFSAKGELAATSVGAVFTPLAVNEAGPGAGLNLTVTRRKPTPVRVGFEGAFRWIPLESSTWTVYSARIVLLY
jgi:hypothetical protein